METTTYYRDGNPKLHKSIRTYFDNFGYESESLSIEQKLVELAVAFHADIDLMPLINDMKDNHPEMSEGTVRGVILSYIDYLRAGHESDFTWLVFYEDSTIPDETFLDLLKKEIELRFSPSYTDWSSLSTGRNNIQPWSFAECFKTIHWDFNSMFKGMSKTEVRKRLLEPTMEKTKDNILIIKH